MTAQVRAFQPASSVKALLDLILEVKFSRHVPLVTILLSVLYATYRSAHYLTSAFHLPWYVAWPTSVFIEALVLAAGAAVFIAHREAFIAELCAEDTDLAAWGVRLSLTLLGIAFAALLGIAWADAWLVTEAHLPAAIMTLAQATQAGLIVQFVISALLDERSKLRKQYADWQRTSVQTAANECPYCRKMVAPNNRKRHMDSCPVRPQP
jgi:hypothetical protein